ncbi:MULTISPECIES: DUF982 domain-containing protein [unclassified Rhizobium]|uniref:DUF982 domain-containing protein n=1 Tax=unclassified Rhizobium TaxID=2613769 RepID=UPI00160CD34C|nr:MULTISPECIES: DUF982 domain-containing protein [unclassified Rhizobium]MBB3316870.1 hypothetical protein [Rhizobium sp. BK181]MBB3541284.1 hypothetical protein [Rhizobium sp. BK399]MCS3740009.1 hypothetical protein [Rhizobium sp. BK661]MCS4092041.1 hypothetical protein [Rhizobium sp. BK176]
MNTISHATEPRWAAPVAIRIGARPSEHIHGPAEAVDYLEHRWPIENSMHLEAAKRRCVEAMNYLAHLEASRDAFVAAAVEAKVLA